MGKYANVRGETIISKSLSQKVKEADTTGYNEFTLKGYMVMSGHDGTITGMQKLMDVSYSTAWRKMKSGEFTRAEMNFLKKELNLTPEQFCDIFVNGKPGVTK